MRKLLSLCVGATLMAVVAGWAQDAVPTVAPDDRNVVHLLLDHPCTVTVQRSPAPHETTTPIPWAVRPTTKVDVHVDLEGDYFVRGHGDGLFVRYQLPPEAVDLVHGTSVYLHPQPVPVWPHVAMAAAALGLLAAAGGVTLWRWVSRQRYLAALPRTPVADRLNLFPADGSLPEVIPPYRILGKLGSGGMAVVYHAENDQGEQFALKMPFPNLLQDSRFMQRFTREAKIGVRLRHPNLVSLLAVNDDSNPECPYPYLVMELVDGVTLDHVLDERRLLPADEALPIVLDVLAGLHLVHAHGIVHRDIKPGNVMVMKSGRARLMDFGIAHKDDTQGGKLTGTEEIIGTPRYMAPEQVQSRPLDGRCDIYSVGVMLYQMLAGTVPYGTDDSYTILGLKCTVPLPKLTSQCDVEPGLGALVDRMVAIDPDDRPGTVAEVVASLQAYNRATTE